MMATEDNLDAGKAWLLEEAERIARDLGLLNVKFTWEGTDRPALLVSYSGKVERRFFETIYLKFAGMGEPDTRAELAKALRSYLENLQRPNMDQ